MMALDLGLGGPRLGGSRAWQEPKEAAGAVRELPPRSAIPEAFRWRLEDIFETPEDWERAALEVERLIQEASAYEGRVGTSAQTLLDALRAEDVLSEKLERVIAYAHMRHDEDTTDPKALAMNDRATSLAVRANAALSYLVPEILAIPPEQLERFFAEAEGLALFRHAIEDIARQRPHVLSASEERILAEAGDVARAASDVFNMLNNADIRFPTIRDEEGQEVELTHGRYHAFIQSDDRRVRHDAFKALYSTYWKQRHTLTALMNANVRKDVFYARMRKYRSALEAALHPNNIPVEVYDNLIQTVRQHLQPLHDYVGLRKRFLGLDEVHMYDLYAPLVREVKWKVPYEQAADVLFDGLSPLGEAYVAQLRRIFQERWIDVYENRGKRSGAYSFGVYGVHPFVLLNYQDTLDDVFTIAHELGHAMHSFYSNRTQPHVYARYTLFVAEVASTCNEALLMHHLLSTVTERERRLYLLYRYLETFRTTLYRQVMFAEFEKHTHEQVEAGKPLTVDALCAYYHQLNVDYYGPDVVVDPEIDIEWARVPHFYRNFYVYQYATGLSAAVYLAQRIVDEGEPAVRRYLQFLSAGGSDYPLQLLQSAGVDMRSPEPIASALQLFARLVRELATLA